MNVSGLFHVFVTGGKRRCEQWMRKGSWVDRYGSASGKDAQSSMVSLLGEVTTTRTP